jgi:predicted metal-dependent phosphoesterase TrpH
MPNFVCDLHTHTKRSDGNDTPRELLETAAAQGLRLLVIADHDITPPATIPTESGEVPTAEFAARLGLVYLGGYEFSCDTLVDDVHIVGIDCDWTHPAIVAEVEAAERSKIDGYRELTEVLTAHGMPLAWHELLENDGSPRPPAAIQRKHIFEAMAARGYTRDWSQAKLLVRDTPAFNIRRAKVDPLQALQAIHLAGGLAVLAHPYLIDDVVARPDGSTLSREAYIRQLIDAGVDGIEARYTYHKTSYKGSLSPEAVADDVRSRYGASVAFLSGGSDYHNDGKKGVTNPRQLGEAGLTWEEFMATPLAQRVPGGWLSEL